MALARKKRRRRKRRGVIMMSQYRGNISTMKSLRLSRVRDRHPKISSSSMENSLIDRDQEVRLRHLLTRGRIPGFILFLVLWKEINLCMIKTSLNRKEIFSLGHRDQWVMMKSILESILLSSLLFHKSKNLTLKIWWVNIHALHKWVYQTFLMSFPPDPNLPR